MAEPHKSPAVTLEHLGALAAGLTLLPAAMTSREARLLLLAIMLQESRGTERWQVIDVNRPQVKGPARGLLQFELGSRESRGGVWGVYLHSASRYWLKVLCDARGVEFKPGAVWPAIEQDDALAFGLGRLLLFTDPKRLPAIGDVGAAWKLYAYRTWRPGAVKRRAAELRAKWSSNYAIAQAATA